MRVVYAIICSESLKLYVGQHTGASLGQYLQQKWLARSYSRGRSHLFAAMRRHPRESWSIHPLVAGIADKLQLDELERHYIKVLKCQHPDIGYNICDGGEGFTGTHSAERNRKFSLARAGHSVSAETRTKIAAGLVGYYRDHPVSPAAMADLARGNTNRRGFCVSTETRLKSSRSQKERRVREDQNV